MAQDWDYTIYSSGNCDEEFKKTVFINGQPVSILMDTGAQVNVLLYGLLCNLWIQPTEVKVATWGQFHLNVVGESWCKVAYRDTTVQTQFVVVQLPTDIQGKTCLTLFSSKLCNQLHIFKESILEQCN